MIQVLTSWKPAFHAVGWKMPDILHHGHSDRAVGHLEKYLDQTENGGRRYSGSYFDTFGGGGDFEDTRDTITAADILAVGFLETPISAHETIQLLTPQDEWPRERLGKDEKGRDYTCAEPRVDHGAARGHPRWAEFE